MADQTLREPDCPECGQPPFMVLDSGRQAFCPNQYCAVIMWDQTLTRRELEADRQVVDFEPTQKPRDL